MSETIKTIAYINGKDIEAVLDAGATKSVTSLEKNRN